MNFTSGTSGGEGDVQAELRLALTAALRTRDQPAMAALRSALSAIGNAEAVRAAPDASAPGPGSEYVAGTAPGVSATEAQRRVLTGEEARALVRSEITERLAAAGEYERAGHLDRAQRLRLEAQALIAATEAG
jgi:hypothetical protein